MADRRGRAGARRLTAGESDCAALRPAVFLDRDGVLTIDRGYTYRVEDLALTRTAAEGVRLINAAGHLAIVATNQSGVARGLFGTDDVERFHAALRLALADQGAYLDAIYYCPFHPDGIVPALACDHEDRKPRPGMLRRAIAEHCISTTLSVMIGDRDSDMAAAKAAGVAGICVPANRCDLAAVIRDRLALSPPAAAARLR